MTAASDTARYLDALPAKARGLLDQMRKAVKAAVPDAKPHFSYGIPSFTLDGKPFIWFAAWKKHASMYPVVEEIRRAHAAELKGYAFSKGTIRFPYDRPPPPAVLKKLAKACATRMRQARGPKAKAEQTLARVRRHCLALPGATEKEAWGAPTFRVKGKLFAMYADAGDHHGEGRPAVWVKSTRENQSVMIDMDPGRFFSPPYMGPSGWVGVWLDKNVSWKMVADVLADGHRLVIS